MLMPAGRPTSYDPADLPKLKELAEAGATNEELADYLGVSIRSIYRWRNENKEFRHAIKISKESADGRIEESLYKRAFGFEHESVKIFCNKDGEVTQVPYKEYVPPDPTSMIFWLKNRKPKEWRDKSEVEIPGLSALADRISKARSRK
jgi:Helix-turn-helix domain